MQYEFGGRRSLGDSALWLRGMVGLACELEWSVVSSKTDR